MLKCEHCLLPFFENEAVYSEINGDRHVFCCHGCKGVFELIRNEGLDKFYQERHWGDEDRVRGRDLFKRLEPSQFYEYIKVEKDGTASIDIYIENIRCASCVWLNEKVLQKTRGIISARINYATHNGRIVWDTSQTSIEEIINRISSIGYTAKPYSESEQFKRQRSETQDLLIRFGTAAFLSSQLMVYTIALYAGYFQDIDRQTRLLLELIALAITTPVIFYSGMPFIRNTLLGLRGLHFTMDTLITVGALSAYIFSIFQIFAGGKVYFDTAAMIVSLILLGRYIEASAKGRASETIQRLSELLPKDARLIRQGEPSYETVPVTSLKIGDRVRTLPGERMPIDGIVIEGETEADESIINGESKPVHKQNGSMVIGGSINISGSIVIEATRRYSETVLSGIIHAVKDAQMRSPKIQTLADKVVGIFVPVVLMLAAGTTAAYLINGSPLQDALMIGISVVVIACPCSLGLAAPLAVLVSTSWAASRGILIKGGDILESAGLVDTVVFDKTGTLTLGRQRLKDIVLFDKHTSRDEVLILSASLERHSEHSIAKALLEAARGFSLLDVQLPEIKPGRGIKGIVNGRAASLGSMAFMRDIGFAVPESSLEAKEFERQGDTVIFAGWDGKVRAMLSISDLIRHEAKAVVEDLKGLGFKVYVLSGDNLITTTAISAQAGIEDVSAEASPEEKQTIVRDMQIKGHRILMIGDGINDAPSLTEASVGAAMARGTDIAMESADVVFVREDLRLASFLIRLSKRTYNIIRQNIFMSFFYNITAVPLAMAGILHPIIAAGAMAASSLCVTVNSLRIRGER